jgi:hypothetical protein
MATPNNDPTQSASFPEYVNLAVVQEMSSESIISLVTPEMLERINRATLPPASSSFTSREEHRQLVADARAHNKDNWKEDCEFFGYYETVFPWSETYPFGYDYYKFLADLIVFKSTDIGILIQINNVHYTKHTLYQFLERFSVAVAAAERPGGTRSPSPSESVVDLPDNMGFDPIAVSKFWGFPDFDKPEDWTNADYKFLMMVSTSPVRRLHQFASFVFLDSIEPQRGVHGRTNEDHLDLVYNRSPTRSSKRIRKHIRKVHHAQYTDDWNGVGYQRARARLNAIAPIEPQAGAGIVHSVSAGLKAIPDLVGLKEELTKINNKIEPLDLARVVEIVENFRITLQSASDRSVDLSASVERSVDRISQSLDSNVQTASSTITGFSGAVNGMSDSLNRISEPLNWPAKVIEWLKEHSDEAALIVTTLMFINGVSNTSDGTSWPLVYGSGIAALYFAYCVNIKHDIIGKFTAFIVRYLGSEPEPQAYSTDVLIEGLAMATMFLFPLFRAESVGLATKQIIKSNSLSKAADTMKGIFDIGLSIIDKLVEWVGWLCGYEFPKLKEYLNPAAREVTDFIERTQKQLELARQMRSDHSTIESWSTHAELLESIMKDVNEWRNKIAKDRSMYLYSRIIEKLYSDCAMWAASLREGVPCGTGLRMEPATLLFTGKPGIGKTVLLNKIFEMLMPTVYGVNPDSEACEVLLNDYSKNKNRYVYTKQAGNKFWSMYANQGMMNMDEILQNNAGENIPLEDHEVLEFIRIVNENPCPLNMNLNEDKGKVHFTSRVVVGTTNVTNLDPFIKGINCKGAYVRRWNLFAHCRLLPEYTLEDGTIDKVKLRRAITTNPMLEYTFPHLTFDIKKSVVSDENLVYKGKEMCGVPFMTVFELFLEIYKDKLDSYSLLSMDTKKFENGHPALRALKSFRCREITPQAFCGECHEVFRSGGRINAIIDKGLSRLSRDIDLATKAVLKQELQIIFDSNLMMSLKHGSQTMFSAMTVDCKCTGFYNACNDGDVAGMREAMRLLGIEAGAENFANVGFGAMFGSFVGNEIKSWLVQHQTNIQRAIIAIIGIYAVAKITSKVMKHFFGQDEKKTQVKGAIECQLRDLQAQEVGDRVVNRNVFAIDLEGSNGETYELGHLLFLVGTIALMPAHFLVKINEYARDDPKSKIVLRRLGDMTNHQKVYVPLGDFMEQWDGITRVYGQDTDLVSVQFPKFKCMSMPSLRQYLADDIQKGGTGIAYRVNKDGMSISSHSCNWRIEHEIEPYFDPVSKDNYTTVNTILYECHGKSGDCGMPLFQQNPKARCQKLLGVHVAGRRGLPVSYAVQLTTGIYDLIVKHYVDMGSQPIVSQAYEKPEDLLNPDFSFDDLPAVPESLRIPGKVNLGYVEPPALASRSAIVRSPIYGAIEEYQAKTRPARLKPFFKDGCLIDPAMIATAKYHMTLKPFETGLLKMCADLYSNEIMNDKISVAPAAGKNILNYEDAVAGIPGIRGIKGIPRKTSAGYPYVKMYSGPLRGKQVFFGTEGDYEFGSAEETKLRQRVECIIANARQNKRLCNVFMDFHKDERRPKEKVVAGSTRKISAAPVDWSIAVRMFYGSFCEWYQTNRIHNGSAVGVNPFGSEWSLIVDYLRPDNKIIAGDFSNYDGRLPYEVMVYFLDFVNAWYGDSKENQIARDVLFQDVCNSRHVLNGVIYEWVGSNASGNPLTTILNTWCNNVLLRYATVMILRSKVPGLNVRQFLGSIKEHVRFMCYGDDNLISVFRKSPYFEYLTQDAYTQAFAEMGLTYTDEEKGTDAISQDRSITDVSFLKRGFKKNFRVAEHRDRYAAPLSINTILESIQWTKSNDTSLEHWRDNVQNMILELSLHEKKVFDEWVTKIVQACREKENFTPYPSDYITCQRIAADREEETLW